jgi:hypothetical protein
MRRLRSWLTYGNVTATIAVFLAMSGAAVAVTTAPRNSVISSSIKDGEVRSADVRGGAVTRAKLGTNAVSGGKVLNGSLTGADVKDDSIGELDIRNGSLSGTDVQDGSISGLDVTESSLGEVPVATLGGLGRYGYSGSCNPEDAAHVLCSTVQVDLPQPARVLVLGSAKAVISQGATYAYGDCRVGNEANPIQASATGFDLTGDSWSQHASSMAVTDVLGPGPHTIGLECNEQSGKIEYPEARVVAVGLSAR